MAEASSISTRRTLMPSGGVCGVLSIMPRICAAACSARSASSASLMPPALPRPPACTCALTTTRPPSRCAIARAWAGVSATSPFGTATPNSRSSALAWYSWIFIRARSHEQRNGLQLAADRIEGEAERLQCQRPEQRRVALFAEDHIGHTDMFAQLEERAALAADDLRAIREMKRLAPQRPNFQSAQHRRRNDGIRGARVDDELEALTDFGLGGISDVDRQRGDTHGNRPPRFRRANGRLASPTRNLGVVWPHRQECLKSDSAHAGCFFCARNFCSSQPMGSKNSSAIRSLSGMIALSVMWMCSGHTSVQHLVMLHNPTPAPSLMNAVRSSVSSGCMSRPASLIKKRGPANARLLSSWSRMTWQTS